MFAKSDVEFYKCPINFWKCFCRISFGCIFIHDYCPNVIHLWMRCLLNLNLTSFSLTSLYRHCVITKIMNKTRGGGTDLERGYGDVRPWRPPFHTSPVVRKGPISSKRVSSQDPLLRKLGNCSLCSLNFHPNFSSQAPKFGNFQLTSPPFSEANVSSQAPHFGNPGRTPLPEKKLSARR